MSVKVTHERLRRLVESGVRGECRPAERIYRLKKRAREIDGLAVTRLEQVFFALADKTRLAILNLLAEEELCSCEITSALELTQPTTSHHVGILERAGLIISRREGKWVFYRFDSKAKGLLTKGLVLVREPA